MLSVLSPTPWVRFWGDDGWSWNIEETDEGTEGSGMPGRGLVAGAVLYWLEANPGTTVADVASVFNLSVPFAEDVMRPDIFSSTSLSEAIQVWSILIGGEVPVGMASAVFAKSPMEVLAAIEDHPWMYTELRGGVICIGHEGE